MTPMFRDTVRSRRGLLSLCVVCLVLATACSTMAGARGPDPVALRGTVQTGDIRLAGYAVSLYGSFVDRTPRWVRLGEGISDTTGRFTITYRLPAGLVNGESSLFVEATRGPAMLAAAIGSGGSVPAQVVVNERTTVATGNAFAQFVDGRKIVGNQYGMSNAVHMAADLADPKTGAVGSVLATSPNGRQTSTLATLNSLANVVASCVANRQSCATLLEVSSPPGGARSSDVLEAIANIVKYPSFPRAHMPAGDPILALSRLATVYRPALKHKPTSWLLFLKFTGGRYSAQNSENLMSGPGNFAIDAKGYVWVDTNAQPEPPSQFACASHRIVKFTPWGQPFPGTPYVGGGLSGQGWGTLLDPRGRVWIDNFGFQDPPCAARPGAAKHDSVSLFRPDGTSVSGPRGYRSGNLSWPMGMASDRRGNIWIANCGNDTVTEYPGGDPSKAINLPVGPTPPAGKPQMKPFGVTIDGDGNAWVNDNFSSNVSVFSPAGKLLATLPSTYAGKTVLSRPIGNATDVQGNVWVANSDYLEEPCPHRFHFGTATSPSITLYKKGTLTPYPGSPFSGGGLTLPWGITVDGAGTVWVFNFGAKPLNDPPYPPTGISRFCGVETDRCPPGLKVGDPISPASGYTSDALERITAGQIDPSGNIWITSNWKLKANPVRNPFGNAIVVAIGAAAPLKTPVIGPPVPAQ